LKYVLNYLFVENQRTSSVKYKTA